MEVQKNDGVQPAPRFRIRWRIAVIVCAAAMPVVTWGLSLLPAFMDRVYSDHIGVAIGLGLGSITAPAPFSVIEIVVYAVLARLLVMSAMAVYGVVRGRRRLRGTLGRGLLRLATTLGIFTLVFYAAWGFNFARPDLITRLGWQEAANATPRQGGVEELVGLCENLIRVTNEEYQRTTGSTDLGQATTPSIPEYAADRAVDHAYGSVAKRLGLSGGFARSRAPAKPVLASPLLSRVLVLGFYSPWTGEANYNWQTPACGLPQVLGHEKAHQRCVGSEDEADFLGFLACAYSDEPYLRYSAYLFAQRTLLFELIRKDPKRAEDLLKLRLPGVQKDVDSIRTFIKSNSGLLSKAGLTVNNAYLEANRVKGGILSYQMSARLLVTFSRVNGGTCVVGDRGGREGRNGEMGK